MNRAYSSDSISEFLCVSTDEMVGRLTQGGGDVVKAQSNAWAEEIRILREVLQGREGYIYFEYSIPRMGRRIDVVLLIGAVIFVLEFKVGGDLFSAKCRT